MDKATQKAERGFSLLEVLIAATILTIGVGALAQLFAVATQANRGARVISIASVLAQQKLEQLRGLAWGFDSLGLPVSDTTTDITVMPERADGGTGLRPSPSGSLGTNTDGYCDFLDGTGRSLGGGTDAPAGTIYTRRWSVEPLPANPGNTLVFQVLVTSRRNRGAADTVVGVERLPDEARFITVKTRKAS